MKSMKSESSMDQSSTPPKLSLYSFPNHRPEPPGMATPPLRLPGSVPFLWEEAPGKPRKDSSPSGPEPGPGPIGGSVAARCLELPPRMVVAAEEEMKFTSMSSSPTTVLDGPDVMGPNASFSPYSASFGEERWGYSYPPVEKRGKSKERVVWFWRRRGRKERRSGDAKVSTGRLEASSSCSLPSSYYYWDEGEREVRISRFRRNRSLASISFNATSHLWASIYGSLKQVVPWSSRKVE